MNMPVKIMIKDAFFILLTALLLTLSAWIFAPPPKEVPHASSPPFQEIDQGMLKLILADDPHLLLDARPSDSYRSGHIPGSVSLPAYEFELRYPQISHLFAPGLTVIVYCSSISCKDADLLAEELQQQGIGNLLLYRAGFAEWLETGNTIDTGEQP